MRNVIKCFPDTTCFGNCWTQVKTFARFLCCCKKVEVLQESQEFRESKVVIEMSTPVVHLRLT